MDLRVLRYFIAVTEEGTFSGAAKILHLTQPTLSRQIQDLEEEVGCKLLKRSRGGISLTEAGKYLHGRAIEMLELASRTKAELSRPNPSISGDIFISCGETNAMHYISLLMKRLRTKHPGIKFHIHSGNAEDVSEKLDKGLADFGIFVRPANLENYDFLSLPMSDTWGLLMRKDNPLAKKNGICAHDLETIELICSRQLMVANDLSGWMGKKADHLNIVATYNLLYNASVMVGEGLGCALCLDGIADTSENSLLCFRPLEPELKVGLDIAWKKNKTFSRAALEFQKIVILELEK